MTLTPPDAMIMSRRKTLRLQLPILAVLLFTLLLVLFLADRTLQADPSEWLQSARNLVQSGDTGLQHRNILFSYILAVPLLLGLDPVLFGLAVSGISLLGSVYLLYRINLKHASPALAAFVSLLFAISYAPLRYGTQVFTDIPALALAIGMVYFQFRFLDERRPLDLVLSYFFASAAISMRYASAFFLFAFLYFAWITRRDWKWHALGVLAAVVPYIPQLIYNVRHLGGPFAISYASAEPVFGLRYFFEDEQAGRRYILLNYLRFLLLDFRLLFALLTPVSLLGAVVSFKRIPRIKAVYLLLFFLSVVLLLSFYAYFSNRYIIHALIPCFIWLAVGLAEIQEWLQERKRLWRIAWVLALAALAYGMFEISFQVIQSSRAVHEARDAAYSDLNQFVQDGDVVITLSGQVNSVLRQSSRQIEVLGPEAITPELLQRYEGRNVYVLWTPMRLTSEGSNWSLTIDAVRSRLEPIHTVRSKPVVELLLYRALRLLGKEDSIPTEEWIIFHVIR